MGEYSAVSGIKVLDRAVAIMMAAANRPSTLNELCDTTGLPRAAAHRLATALEVHRILTRTPDGKWGAGPALPGNRDHIIEAAGPIMERLLAETGESVQLYQLGQFSHLHCHSRARVRLAQRGTGRPPATAYFRFSRPHFRGIRQHRHHWGHL